VRGEFKVSVEDNGARLRIIRDGVFQKDISLTRKARAARQVAAYLQQIYKKSLAEAHVRASGEDRFLADGETVSFEGRGRAFAFPVEITDADRIQSWLNELIRPGARSELRDRVQHLMAAKSPQEAGHFLAELLVTGKMNSQDKAILGKALEAEFGSAKTVKPAPRVRSKTRIVLMAIMLAVAGFLGAGCESSSSESEPPGNIDLNSGQSVPILLQAYGGGSVSGNQFIGGVESAAVVRENFSGGSMNIVLSVGAGEVIVGPIMPGQISGNTLDIELQTSGGSSDLGQDAPHPDWQRLGPGMADFFLSIPEGAIGVFYFLPGGGNFTIHSMTVYGTRAEVRIKESAEEETGVGATLSGFEPVEKKIARVKHFHKIPVERSSTIRSSKNIIRLFASDVPAGQEHQKRSEMRLDDVSFAEGVAKIKAMYEYTMTLLLGLTPEDIKVTFDHSYTEIIKEEGQPDRKVPKTVPVTLELFIPQSIEEVRRVIEIEQNSWRTMNGVEIPEEEILERIFGDEDTGNPPNPIIVARVNGKIEGGIYMSFESLEKFPKTYKTAQHTLNPKDSDDVVDFSVFTERATSAYQLFPVLARATVAFAQMYGIDKVSAYSRSEPFSRHIANNPLFQVRDYQNKEGLVDPKKGFEGFARFVRKQGRNIEEGVSFEDYRKFFRIDVFSVMDFFEAEKIFEKALKDILKKKKTQGSGPTLEQVRKYLTISGFESFEDYAAFHIMQIGDPFLSSTHLALGAKFVHYIPHSRLEDLRAMQGNAIVVYDAPVLPEANRKINLLGKPISHDRSKPSKEAVLVSERVAIAPEVLKVERKFGTNGIRGTGFNIDELRRMTTATAMELLGVWKRGHAVEPLPVIGVAADPRPQGAEGFSEEPAKKMAYARAIAEVLAAFGFKVRFYAQPVGSGHMIATTSAAYPAESRNFAVLMGTASHNEVVDPKSGELQFGLKVFMGNAPIMDDFAARISDHINGNAKLNISQVTEAPRLDFDGAVGEGKLEGGEDPVAVEFERLDGHFNVAELGRLFREKFPVTKIALNAMNGGTAKLAPAILKAMGFTDSNSRAFNTIFMNDPAMETTVMGTVPDSSGKQVRFAPDPTRAWFRGKDYDAYVSQDPANTISLLIDGDADRLVLESMGEISPNQIGPIVKYYLWNYLKDRDSRYVDARTVPTTSAMDLLDKALGVSEPKVTDVGSKNFVPFLGDLQIGLEESGHIAFRYKGQVFFDHPVALMLLMMKMMADTGKTWRELENEMWSFISKRTGASRIETSRTGIGKDEGAEAYYPLLAKLPKDVGLRQKFGEALAKEFQAQGLDITLEGFDTRAPGGVQFHLSSFVRVMPRKSGTDGSVRFYFEAPSDKVAFLKKAGTLVMKKVLDQFISPVETRTVIGVEELKMKIGQVRKFSTMRSLSVIDALTRQQIQEEIQVLTEEDFRSFSAEEMRGLIDWEIEALMDWQIELLTHEQRVWLSARLDELSSTLLGKGQANRAEVRGEVPAWRDYDSGEREAIDQSEAKALIAKIEVFKTASRNSISPEMWRILHLTRNGAQTAKNAMEEMQGLTKRGVQDLGKGEIQGLTAWHIQSMQDWHVLAMTHEQKGWLSGRVDQLSSAISRAVERSEARSLGKIFAEGFLGSAVGLACSTITIAAFLGFSPGASDWGILLTTGSLASIVFASLRTLYVWWSTPYSIPTLERWNHRIPPTKVAENLIAKRKADLQRMIPPPVVFDAKEEKPTENVRLSDIPNAALYATSLLLRRSEVRGFVKIFEETFFKAAVLFAFAAFVIYVGDQANESAYFTTASWKVFLMGGIFLSALVAAVKSFYVGQHARSEQLKRYKAIAKGIMAESDKKFHETTKLDQRSEARQLEAIDSVVQALSQKDPEWADFILTSLKEEPFFNRLPAWIAGAIDRGLAAEPIEQDGAEWYKKNREALIQKLGFCPDVPEKEKSSASRLKIRESFEGGASRASVDQASNMIREVLEKRMSDKNIQVLIRDGKEKLLARYLENMEKGATQEAASISASLDLLVITPEEDETLIEKAEWVRRGIAAHFNLALHSQTYMSHWGRSEARIAQTVKEVRDIYRDFEVFEIITQKFRSGIVAAHIVRVLRAAGTMGRLAIERLSGIPLANAADRVSLEDQLTSEELERLRLLNASGPVALQTSRGDTVFTSGNEGTVFMDPEFLVIFAQHDGRGFYDMLQANEPAAGSMEEKPILTAGDAGIIGQIAAILENRNSGLEPSERANRTGIERLLREVIAVKPLEGSQAATINQLIESHKDMVTLLSSEDMLVGLNEGANFAFKNRLAKENAKLVLRALFGRMKMLASQLKGANPADQERLLKEFNARQLGGLKKTQGGFVFENILLLVQSFLAQERATAISA
jgi:phosphomannomutase